MSSLYFLTAIMHRVFRDGLKSKTYISLWSINFSSAFSLSFEAEVFDIGLKIKF